MQYREIILGAIWFFNCLTIKKRMLDWHNYFLIFHDVGLKKGTPLTISHRHSVISSWLICLPSDTREYVMFYAFIIGLSLHMQWGSAVAQW